jgi:tetratricopeptide (TPR) repeat protein
MPNPNCPFCGSAETQYKARAGEWECGVCERRFPDPHAGLTIKSAAPPPGQAAQPRRIFFSYGHDANRELVDRFRADLEKRGHHVWIDYKELGTWEDWKGGITRGISDSQMAVAFLSIHSTRDPGVCRNEIAIALQHFGTVYPILVEAVPQESIPATLAHLQWPDLSQWREFQRNGNGQFERWYEERLVEIITKVEGDATRFANEADALRKILAPPGFDGRFAQHLAGFVGRDWVLDSFDQWLNHAPLSRVFWLKAGPGFGKTALAVALTTRRRAAIVAAWFCDHQSVELRDPARAVCGIAFQLALRWEDYRVRLLPRLGLHSGATAAQIDDARRELMRRNLGDLFSHIISEPLAGLIWREHKLVLLVDGLDEATGQDGSNPLAALIAGRFLELPPWICFVVTSRPEPSVVSHLQRFLPFEIHAHESQNAADLYEFCHRALTPHFLAAGVPEAGFRSLYNLLVEKSGGMVLYLRMVEEGLREGALQVQSLSQLEAGFGGLFSRYHAAFEHRFGGCFAERAQPLLRLLLAAPGPLPIDLAAEALGCGRESVRTMQLHLGAYLIEGSGGLALFHKTLREWLESPGPFHTDPEPGLTALGALLWSYFEQRQTVAGCTLPIRHEAAVLTMFEVCIPTLPQLQTPENLLAFADWLQERCAWPAAERFYRLAISGGGPLLPNTLAAQAGLSRLLRATGNYGEARRLCEVTLEQYRLILGPTDPVTLRSISDLGVLLHDLGDYQKAEPLHLEALRGRRQVLGSKHPDTLASANILGVLYSDRGELQPAEALYREALEGLEEQLGPDHPRTLILADNLGVLLMNREQWGEAEQLLRRALTGNTRILGPSHPYTLWSLAGLGRLLRDSNRPHEAEPLLREALERREQVLGPTHANTLWSALDLGLLLGKAGDHSGAEALLRRAYEGNTALFGPNHPETLQAGQALDNLLKSET